MSTAGQKAKHARAQARYKRKQAAQKRKADSQWQEGNLENLVHGGGVNPENLPAEYHVQYLATTPTQELLEVLDTMRGAALILLDQIKECAHPDSNKSVGPYLNLHSRLIKLSGMATAGKIKPAAFGQLEDRWVLDKEAELARALSAGMTKLQYQYPWLQEHGLVSDDGAYYRFAVEALAGTLSGCATTIETWMQIRRWDEIKKNKVEDPIIGAYGKTHA